MSQAPLRSGIAAACGLLILSGSAVLGALWAVAVALGGGPAETGVYGALALMGFVMGVGLVAAGIGGRLARATFGVSGPGRWLAAFVVALVGGQVVLTSGGPIVAVLFPVIQFATVLCAALAVMSTISWRARGVGLTDVWSGLAFGGCLAAGAALVFEALAVVLIAGLVFAVAQAQGWDDALRDVATQAMEATQGGTPLDPALLIDIALRPAVIVAAFSLLGFIGPLGEELAKGVGVWARRPVSRYRAWLFGTAAGAGFGMTEAIALGALVLDQWAVGMLVRAAAMIMHTTMSGLMGLSWHAYFVERRRSRGLVLFAVASGGHMLWNSLVLSAVVFGTLAVRDEQQMWTLAASSSAFGLVAIFTLVLLLFRSLANRLAAESVSEEPA